MKAQKFTLLSVLLAMAIVLSIVEGFIPSFGIPGIKLGLANIVILLILYEFGIKEAIAVDVMRIYLCGLLRGTLFQMGFFMSLTGGLISLIIMILLKIIFKKMSIVFVSVFGSIFHILGQILIAIIYLGSTAVISYLPILFIVSVITGIIVGLVTIGIRKTKVIEKLKIRYGIE